MSFRAVVLLPQRNWAVVDQVLWSGSNFVAGVVVARALGPSAFGEYAIAVAGWLVLVALCRAIVAQPLVIELSRLTSKEPAAALRQTVGAVMMVGAGVGLLAALIGALTFRNTPTGPIVVVSLFLPLLLAQDLLRYLALATGNARKAALNDAIWVVTQAIALVALWVLFEPSSVTGVFSWAVGGATALVYALHQFDARPTFGRSAIRRLKSFSSLGGWFGLSSGLYLIAEQAVLAMVGVVAGRAAVGGYRGMFSLYGPLQLVTMASEPVALGRSARGFGERSSEAMVDLRRFSLSLGSLAIVYVAIVSLSGASVVGWVYGAEFERFAPLLLGVGCSFVAGSIGLGASVGLRARGAGKRLVLAQGVGSAARVCFVGIGMAASGLPGAAWGLAAAAALHSTLLWWHLTRDVASSQATTLSVSRAPSGIGSF